MVSVLIFHICLFHLPTVSGVLGDKRNAQSQVSAVVGIYAGVTVFSLTVQWFMTMLSASKPLKKDADEQEHGFLSKIKFGNLIGLVYESIQNQYQITDNNEVFFIDNAVVFAAEHGVDVDYDTCRTAKIMLLSLIPYVVLQLVYAFDTSSGKRIITLVALVVSSLSLFSYFAYQVGSSRAHIYVFMSVKHFRVVIFLGYSDKESMDAAKKFKLFEI